MILYLDENGGDNVPKVFCTLHSDYEYANDFHDKIFKLSRSMCLIGNILNFQ